MIFFLASILYLEMIFVLHLWCCELVKFRFWLWSTIIKTTPSNSSPSIYEIINQKTNEMIEGVNQHYSSLIFCISLNNSQLKEMKLWKVKHMSTHSLWLILNAHKMMMPHLTIKSPPVFFENAPKFHFSIFENYTLKKAPKLKVFRMLRMHQTLLTIQNGS